MRLTCNNSVSFNRYKEQGIDAEEERFCAVKAFYKGNGYVKGKRWFSELIRSYISNLNFRQKYLFIGFEPKSKLVVPEHHVPSRFRLWTSIRISGLE